MRADEKSHVYYVDILCMVLWYVLTILYCLVFQAIGHVSYYLLLEETAVVFFSLFRIFILSVIYIVIFCKDVECDRSFLDSLILVFAKIAALI